MGTNVTPYIGNRGSFWDTNNLYVFCSNMFVMESTLLYFGVIPDTEAETYVVVSLLQGFLHLLWADTDPHSVQCGCQALLIERAIAVLCKLLKDFFEGYMW